MSFWGLFFAQFLSLHFSDSPTLCNYFQPLKKRWFCCCYFSFFLFKDLYALKKQQKEEFGKDTFEGILSITQLQYTDLLLSTPYSAQRLQFTRRAAF